jgi:starch-binding outer membrane protein, SusD/RagB family
MTAIQAINKIRSRINQPDILPVFTATKESFRPRIKNERNVELVFEGHYYHDIRRWMDAPKIYEGGLMGVDIEKVTVSPSYPSGFRYTRVPLPATRQTTWKPQMYYWPFVASDNFKMKNFKTNPDW